MEIEEVKREETFSTVKNHIDDFLDNMRFGSSQAERYAYLFLTIARFPAWKKNLCEDFVSLPILCHYRKKQYRLTGASRLGDVWLREDITRTNGYDLRVDVTELSNFTVMGMPSWGNKG